MKKIVRELRYVRADELAPHPQNWRTHPESQMAALIASIDAVGYAVPIIARELPGGTLRIIDGHLRAKTVSDEEVPVIVLDVTDEEERLLLATIDPLSGEAFANADMLSTLLAELKVDMPKLDGNFPVLDEFLQKISFDAGLHKLDEFAEWEGMPDFDQNVTGDDYQTIKVHFKNASGVKSFGELLNQRVTDTTKYLHFPAEPRVDTTNERWEAGEEGKARRFPVYIPSKGRHESRLTMKALDAMNIPFQVIVEEQEYDQYAAVIDPEKILILDAAHQEDYDAHDPLGPLSGPARNFAWDHSMANGHDWHWIMDDNIRYFYRLHRNQKIRCADAFPFKAMEDFVLRYENVAMAGPNYEMFVPRKDCRIPFVVNTRLYSCNLIRNDVPFRWRGRWNEDTDLSLRMLKAGWATVQFNAFLQHKVITQQVKGGSTEIYKEAGTKRKSQALVSLHPDVARVVQRFGRDHHHVDYRPFKRNPLRKKSGGIPVVDYKLRQVTLSSAQAS